MKPLFVMFCVGAIIGMTHAPASAALVDSISLGDDLGGGTLIVTFQFAGPIPGTIIGTPATQTGSVTVPGFFSFSVAGDTYVAPWNLTNLADDWIIRADFDLSPILTLFDDNASPSTPNGAAGRLGAVRIGGPLDIGSLEYNPWADSQNLGDEYECEWIQWAPGVFGPGLTYVWEDDTDDYVPEPMTMSLLALGGLALLRRKK